MRLPQPLLIEAGTHKREPPRAELQIEPGPLPRREQKLHCFWLRSAAVFRRARLCQPYWSRVSRALPVPRPDTTPRHSLDCAYSSAIPPAVVDASHCIHVRLCIPTEPMDDQLVTGQLD